MIVIQKFYKAILILGITFSLTLVVVFSEEFTPPDKRKMTEDRIRRIKEDLEEIRGLTFKKKIKISYKSREEMTLLVKGLMRREQSQAMKGGENKALVEFGFIEEGIDVEALWANFYARQALGFYNIENATLVLISDILTDKDILKHPDLAEANKILYEHFGIELIDFAFFHELDHALVDQNFHLKEFRKSVEDHFDNALSYVAIIEGEAILASHIFEFRPLGVEKEIVNRKFSIDNIIDQQSCMGLMEELSNYPGYITAISLFPYQYGLDFITEVYVQKGWQGVNALYSSPPSSTEQILHPEKYTLKIDSPKKVVIENIEAFLGKEWKKIDQNTLGEFRIQFLISHILEKDDTALIASEGWGGDRYALFENGKGDLLLYFKSVWDSENDALEFYKAYLRTFQNRSFLAEDIPSKKEYERTLNKGPIEIFISLDGDAVEMIKGPASQIRKLKGALSEDKNRLLSNE